MGTGYFDDGQECLFYRKEKTLTVASKTTARAGGIKVLFSYELELTSARVDEPMPRCICSKRSGLSSAMDSTMVSGW